MEIPAPECRVPPNGTVHDHLIRSNDLGIAADAGRTTAIRPPMLVQLVLVPFFAVLTQYATPSFGHDEASWIQKNPEYVDRLGHHCCGPQDCERIPEGYIYEEGDEIVVVPTQQRLRRGVHGTYPSIDGAWWWCKARPMPGMSGLRANCIFFPFHSQ